MAGSGDNVKLLFAGKVDEFNGIAGYPHGKLRILLRMSLRVQESFPGKYIYIQMVSALFSITVQSIN